MKNMLALYLSLVDSLSDKEKVERIYTRYYGIMMYIAVGYTQTDAEDVVHDSMLKIIRNIDKIDISDDLKTKSFCITVARNMAIDYMRKKDNNTEVYNDDIKTVNKLGDPIEFTEINEIYTSLRKALESLNETYKTVCTLKYVNGLKEHEIAEVLGLPPKTVSVRIFRGKQILREAIRKEECYDG
ncbi:MAG: sigma-70 family RNA polymerase sigma factor [Faecalibacterium sp.]|nr:sigma-70 family RNA polymerase sigma factor [Ruminococcus flavefaciens]MCM1363234.1 sigma-70 family RNA polymerase sigma factor [Clostridiales bacterium]MCM1484623.1 sigma-70 family RNA polymerase sigma factor [Faecalibacterium sp.]